MVSERPNLVQAEFILRPRHITTFEGMFRESLERRMDGSSIKLVVRFFDRGGVITKLVTDLAGVAQERNEILALYLAPMNFLEQWWTRRREKRMHRRHTSLDVQKIPLAVKILQEAMTARESVAVENLEDRSFRLARSDEFHEMTESARVAANVWLFLSEPQDILADNLSVKESVW
ncbi:hypothetical protein K8Q93_03575 [Candidatus Parcubacteria bacterium]|nr:hypothetical protein [Candidatus Parcubacteria bacterium]